MKKSIKETEKTKVSSTNKKNTRPFTTKKAGYKEDVYNNEEQRTYQKSDAAKKDKKNTAAPKS
jgi:hypothetical protein